MSFTVYDRCPICHQFSFLNSHRCPPAWQVRLEWHEEEDAALVYAESPATAAARYLEERFVQFEYPTSVIAIVQRDGEAWTFEVDVEQVPRFYATEVSHEEIQEQK